MHLKANTKVKSLEQLDYIQATRWGKNPQQNSNQARQDLGSIHVVSYGLVPSDPHHAPVSQDERFVPRTSASLPAS